MASLTVLDVTSICHIRLGSTYRPQEDRPRIAVYDALSFTATAKQCVSGTAAQCIWQDNTVTASVSEGAHGSMPSFVEAPRVVAGAGGSRMPLEYDMMVYDLWYALGWDTSGEGESRGVSSTPHPHVRARSCRLSSSSKKRDQKVQVYTLLYLPDGT